MKKLLIGIGIAITLCGCANTVYPEVTTNIGFLYGVWHGFILPVSWLCSLFNEDVAIYAVNNSGGWYDFGFLVGISTTISRTISSQSS